ncbi:ABC transporter substrate-binding protein [Gordonia sp. HS-NH1]|uniref:ABC transporter substrate-binding protein n=1 Tax=Gordonia sp. HS-NH1 TaxID=1435068 RepID=UPI0006E36F88|nr:ABC transporter substrate-binding protein [Gordonia sp. HS-NH1]
MRSRQTRNSLIHNRLRRLIVTVATVVGLLVVGACAADPEPGSGGGAPSGEPAPGGTFTIALDKYPERGLNPHYGSAFDASQVLRNTYDSLISEDADENFHPWLASSWTISPDGRTYEFRLRDGVTFSNGEKLDAAAVKANLDALRDPNYPSWTTNGLLQYSSVSDVVVVDPATVRLTLSQPRADLLSTLAGLSGAIVAPSTLRGDKATLTSGADMIGSGPFILDRVVQGQEIHFRKNPAYRWGPATARHTGPAHVDDVVVKYVPEASTRAGLLRSGEVDAIGTVKATDIPLFKDVSGFQYAQTGSAASTTVIMLNVTDGATRDVRVRRAISRGVDLESLVESVTKGSQERAWSLISPDSKYFDAKYDDAAPADLPLAKKLLDEAGWRTSGQDGDIRTNDAGQRLTIRLVATTPTYPQDDVLKAWQAELRQNLGVDVELKYVENAQVYDLLAQNDYQAFPRQVGGLDLSLQLNRAFGSTKPDLTYGQIDGITLGSIVGGSKLADPQVDRWLLDATRATDQNTRKELFDKVTGYILDNAVAIPLYTDRNSVAATSEVHGLTSLFDPPRNSVNGWAYDIAVRTG